MKKNTPVTFAIAGFGSRGSTYASMQEIYPDRMKVTAVADTDPEKVKKAQKLYSIPDENCFESAEEMLSRPRLADAVCICTMDRSHAEEGISAIEKGYDIVLEKPISPDPEECRKILKAAKMSKSRIVVCHVLRYTPFFNTVRDIIRSGEIGDVVSVTGNENVAYWHMAHSFVRGNWRNSTETSPMILQKCCHDMDIMIWLTGKRCRAVSSFGSTRLFKKENAPEGAAPFCLGGCKAKEKCIFDAEKIYVTDERTGIRHGHSFLTDVLSTEPSEKTVYEAIKKGPYGRCVYMCDNDVVDHQVTNLLMEDGSTISFTMCAFTDKCYRYIHVMGTQGEITGDMDSNIVKSVRFGNPWKEYDLNNDSGISGHGGGDSGIIDEFLDQIINDRDDNDRTTTIERSMESHFMAFAAEKSRLNGGMPVSIDEYRK